MGVNVKMGVDLGDFTAGIKQGQSILKGLNAEMKATESEFKATGNAQQMLEKKTKTLNSQLNIQKGIADQAKQALKQMDKEGVQPTDKDYQRLYGTLMQAQSGMYEAQAALKALGQGAEDTAKKADTLTESVNGISKKISLEQVLKGVNSISSGLENAASKAKALGEQIWNAVMDRAKWADDTATMAQMYGIDIVKFQKMQKLVTNGMDTSVEAMLKSQDKLKKGIGDGSKSVIEAFDQLGIRFKTYQKTATGQQLMPRDSIELFWEAGQAIYALDNEFDQESKAQALFGRSWKELSDLFKNYKTVEDYNKALDEQSYVSEESVDKLVKLNDEVGRLQGNFDDLKAEVLSGLAPALTGASTALSGLLEQLLAYLKTDDGKKLLNDLGTAVSGLFEDLGKIDPQKVVEGFTGVFNKVVESFQWLLDNKDTVAGVMEGILAAWALVKVSGGALQVLELVNGLKGLTGAGGAAAAAKAGAAAGTSYATGFVNAFVAAAPIMAGLLGVTTIAVTPAVAVQKKIEDEWKKQQDKQLEAAAKASADNKKFIEDAAKATGPKKNADGTYQTNGLGFLDMNPTGEAGNLLMELKARQGVQRAELMNIIRNFAPYTNGSFTNELLMEYWNNPNSYKFDEATIDALLENITNALVKHENGEKPEVPIDLKPPEDAPKKIQEEVGTVQIPVSLIPTMAGYVTGGQAEGGGSGKPWTKQKYANGLPFVPYDNYLAILHKGEQVVPARAVNSRNFTSNIYYDKVIMNNGQDAEGLAQRIAAEQRREMNSLGS